ncbi:MAG: hypothetical protein HZC37_01365 [Burkholderiales bacterium]|nr:hypothetical protein [Burkholderiales bacterium]
MLGALRSLVICFMAAVIPLKGLAGASMLGCGPGHHGSTSTQESGSTRPAPGPGEHAAHAVHHAPESSAAVPRESSRASASDAVPAESARSGQADDHRVAVTKCSSCAPCCAAAAPGSEPVRLPEFQTTIRIAALRAQPHVGVDPDVPLRPPRPLLA